MQLLDRKLRCTLCGAKNDPGNLRCEICTRPFPSDGSAAQSVYEEALWTQPIDAKRRRKVAFHPIVAALILVAVAAVVNYEVTKWGPEWAHGPQDIVKASDWKTYRGQPGVRVDLPGNPMVSSVTAPSGVLAVAQVWVDGNWLLLRDADTRAVGPLATARASLYSTLVLATGAAPTDRRTGAQAAVGALEPDATVADLKTTELQNPRFGQQFDVTGTYTGHPDESGHGSFAARVIIFDGQMFIGATFAPGGVDPALHSEFIADLVPDGAPAPLVESET